MNAYELDTILQRRKAEAEGRDPDARCYEAEPNGLPCTKVRGHDGPHYSAIGAELLGGGAPGAQAWPRG